MRAIALAIIITALVRIDRSKMTNPIRNTIWTITGWCIGAFIVCLMAGI